MDKILQISISRFLLYQKKSEGENYLLDTVHYMIIKTLRHIRGGSDLTFKMNNHPIGEK